MDQIMEFVRYLQNVHMEDLNDNFQNECIHNQAYLKNKCNMQILQLCK